MIRRANNLLRAVKLSSSSVVSSLMTEAEARAALPGPAADGTPQDRTLPLRVSAIFIVAAVSLLGTMVAVLTDHHQQPPSDRRPLSQRLLKCLAAGVIASVGFVHLLAESSEMLSKVTAYPLAHVMALAGAILIVVLNQLLVHVMGGDQAGQTAASGSSGGDECEAVVVITDDDNSVRHQQSAARCSPLPPPPELLMVPVPPCKQQQQQQQQQQQHHHHHMDGGGSAPGAGSAAASGKEEDHCAASIAHSFKTKPLLVAYLMELGILFHSVIIGVGLGVLGGNLDEVRSLLVAVCFHQFFEGAGLATCIMEAHLSRSKTALMIGLFSITTPLGIALGIGISHSYDPHSLTAILVQGLLNALAAGILIHLSLVDMLAQEVSRQDVKGDLRLQSLMLAALLVGATAMSLLTLAE